jgi:hypothetical protein
MKSKPLTPPFRDALTMTARRGDSGVGPVADGQPDVVLVKELERAILERDYLDGYLEWIETNLFARDYPRFEADEALLARALASGLGQLDRERLHRLALDPIAVLGLREQVLEAMPEYWWNRMKELSHGYGDGATAEEFWQGLMSRLDRQPARKARRPAAVGSFRYGDPETPPASIGKCWTVELPVEGALMEFTQRGVGHTNILEVRLFGALRLSSSVRCTARLVNRDGKEVSRSVNAGHVLTLPLPSQDVSGLRLECDWSKGGDLHWRFETPVSVPEEKR